MMAHPILAMARLHSWLSPYARLCLGPTGRGGSWRYITQFWYIIFQTARSKLTHAQDVSAYALRLCIGLSSSSRRRPQRRWNQRRKNENGPEYRGHFETIISDFRRARPRKNASVREARMRA